MKLNLYTVYDKVAEDSAPPFAAKSHKVAFRMFVSLLRSAGVDDAGMDDYQLVHIAEYDTEVLGGQITLVPPEIITGGGE